MKLLSYNIQYGYGADGLYDLTRAAKVIGAADIIALQEAERHWSRPRHDAHPAILERLLPNYYTAYGPGFDMDSGVLPVALCGNDRPVVRADGGAGDHARL